ncbi:MAG: fused MFS/spermidine synthase, partial [Syntrophales bacterium]|nr:fused MFS/spermidine synthase [Syntrophales bacterium]
IELVAGRIMAPYVGVSLYTWTSIIGVVLAGISIGAYAGGLIADRFPRASTLGWLLFLSGIAALTISPLTNFAGNVHLQTSLMVRILLLTAAIFFIPSCLLGMISPVVVKLTLSNLEKTGNVVGKIYAFSTLGSILGTFATGFFLISWMGTRNLLFTMGAILIASAPVFGGGFMKKKFFAAFLAVLAPLLWAFYGHAFRAPVDSSTYYFEESDYYTIKAKKHRTRDKKRMVDALVLDHLVHSINDTENPLYLDYEYIRMYEEFVRWHLGGNNSPRALFIGGGGYTFPRYLDAKYPGAEIDVVEIDPAVTEAAYRYMGLSRDTRIRSFNEDGRWFVMNSREKGKYDFIFGDAFNDLSIPYHLTTLEFNRMLADLLKPDGILLANLIDSYERGLFLPSYIRTLEEVFGRGNVHLVSRSPNYRKLGISTFIIIASRKPLDISDFNAAVTVQAGAGKMSFVIPQEELQQHLAERSPFVLTDDYVPADNLIAPIFEERFGYAKK